MPRPRARVVRATLTAAATVALVALAGCSGGAMPTPTPTVTPTPTGDGVLTIGTLFPSSGGVTFIGPAQVAGVNAAVREINAAGGVNGEKIVVVNRDSGDATTEKVEKSFAELVDKGVDVIIGPSSSVLSQRLLDLATDAGIPLVSPAATYPQLTVLDETDIFFRTIPSAPHQAIVLADQFAAAEVESVALVYRDDDLGGALEAALRTTLDRLGIELEAIVVGEKAEGDELDDIVAAAKEAAPDVVVLATPDNGEQTRGLISRLKKAELGGDKLWLTSQNVADYSQSLPKKTLDGVRGIVEGAAPDTAFETKIRKEDPGVRSFRYAAEAYDATVLVALAAHLAADDGGSSIARLLRSASVDGIKCTSYGECLDVLRTQTDIDYDGISGSVNLDPAGEVVRGTYQLIGYNAENKYSVKATAIG